MDRDLIAKLAEEACLGVASSDGEIYSHGRGGEDIRDPLERFAALIAEECAKVAENYAAACEEESPYGASAAKDIADNIREKFSKGT